MMDQRSFAKGVVGTALVLGAAGLSGRPLGAGQTRIEPELSDDGLYHQSWFLDSFLDLGDDLAEGDTLARHITTWLSPIISLENAVLLGQSINDSFGAASVTVSTPIILPPAP